MADDNAAPDAAAPSANPASEDAARANGSKGADKPAGKPGAESGLKLNRAQLALYAGWTMAVIYGTIPGDPAPEARVQAERAPAALGKPEHAGTHSSVNPPELPSVNELPPVERRKLELARLGHLLSALLPDVPSWPKLDVLRAGNERDNPVTRKADLDSLNLDILIDLTGQSPELQLAYQLGRSLRDTANPPDVASDGLSRQLGRQRIAKLQQWLVTLSPEFPDLTAAVVAGSLGRWSDLTAVTIGANETRQASSKSATRPPRSTPYTLAPLPPKDRQASIAESMCTYLLQQGDVWLMLLTGELQTSGLLTPEGYVTAGEAALHRSGVIARGVIRHYWFALLAIAVALGFTLFLAARYLGGASKVWTSIAGIGGALGYSAQAIASRSSRLTAEAGRPVFAMAEEDAMAWAITTLPPVTLTFRGVRHLRRAGVAPSSSLSRF
ncbi:MAG TPA: hypothetical protein VMA72_12430 [Streptosporangiaceae bacterium]|nr:hypothetical protein [Streptosporangiaceae bacterium]